MSLWNSQNPRGRCQVVGMIHIAALPGSPRGELPIAGIVNRAREEAAIFREAGVDAVMIENMHDRPYMKGSAGPEVVAAMTVVAVAVKEAFGGPCGIQVLAGANREALAIALAAGFEFIRAEGFVFAHVADEGIIEGCAGDLLRYRREIGAESVDVLADVKKKHSSHAITADIDVAESAKAAEFFLADGVIVTGGATGSPAAVEDVRAVKEATKLPVFVGSGVDVHNVAEFAGIADGVIVGSSLKEEDKWDGALSLARVQALLGVLDQPK